MSVKEEDKQLKDWLKKGGREGSKQDFLTLLKRASKPVPQQPEQVKRQTS